MNKSWWAILLSLWLVLYGVFAVSNIEVQFENFIMGILAVVTALALLFNK